MKFVHRKALRDVKYKGYYIPAGWQVLPVFTAVHLDPAIHQNPSKFDPSRWNVCTLSIVAPVYSAIFHSVFCNTFGLVKCMQDRSMRKIVNPFGGGMRLCPGTDLAKLEATIFLHHLVLNYRYILFAYYTARNTEFSNFRVYRKKKLIWS